MSSTKQMLSRAIVTALVGAAVTTASAQTGVSLVKDQQLLKEKLNGKLVPMDQLFFNRFRAAEILDVEIDPISQQVVVLISFDRVDRHIATVDFSTGDGVVLAETSVDIQRLKFGPAGHLYGARHTTRPGGRDTLVIYGVSMMDGSATEITEVDADADPDDLRTILPFPPGTLLHKFDLNDDRRRRLAMSTNAHVPDEWTPPDFAVSGPDLGDHPARKSRGQIAFSTDAQAPDEWTPPYDGGGDVPDPGTGRPGGVIDNGRPTQKNRPQVAFSTNAQAPDEWTPPYDGGGDVPDLGTGRPGGVIDNGRPTQKNRPQVAFSTNAQAPDEWTPPYDGGGDVPDLGTGRPGGVIDNGRPMQKSRPQIAFSTNAQVPDAWTAPETAERPTGPTIVDRKWSKNSGQLVYAVIRTSGAEEASLVDYNNDGVLDAQDAALFIRAFGAGNADLNRDGETNSEDLFIFFEELLENSDRIGEPDSGDLLVFLSAWNNAFGG